MLVFWVDRSETVSMNGTSPAEAGQNTATNGKVVVVGSINADLGLLVDRFLLPGETRQGTGGELSPGGKGANQATAAALQGADVTMIGAVGDDTAAEAATRLMRAGGVHLDKLHVEPGPTGLAVVTVDASGENQIIIIRGANAAMTAERVRAQADAIAAASVVVLQGEIPLDGGAAAARLATGRVLLNLAPAVPMEPDVIRLADPLVVNELEAVTALEILAPGTPVPATDEGIVAALRDAGVASVVMTIGPRGALVTDGTEVVALPAPTVHAVDTTGAGDAFVGALAARLAAGASLVEASQLAVRVGSYSVQRMGAQASYPMGDADLPLP